MLYQCRVRTARVSAWFTLFMGWTGPQCTETTWSRPISIIFCVATEPPHHLRQYRTQHKPCVGRESVRYLSGTRSTPRSTCHPQKAQSQTLQRSISRTGLIRLPSCDPSPHPRSILPRCAAQLVGGSHSGAPDKGMPEISPSRTLLKQFRYKAVIQQQYYERKGASRDYQDFFPPHHQRTLIRPEPENAADARRHGNVHDVQHDSSVPEQGAEIEFAVVLDQDENLVDSHTAYALVLRCPALTRRMEQPAS